MLQVQVALLELLEGQDQLDQWDSLVYKVIQDRQVIRVGLVAEGLLVLQVTLGRLDHQVRLELRDHVVLKVFLV